MTYLLPDDWYANHGLAPGDARRPQAILEPRPGNLAPTPPMRGYFGKPPLPVLRPRHATVSPFAVPDIMWGVHGLGDDQQVAAIMARLGKELKQAAIKQASINTGITAGLMAVPVAGWALAPIYAAVVSIVGAKYQAEIKQVMAEAENEARKMQAQYQAKLSNAQAASVLVVQDVAVALATSCQALNGLGDFWSNVFGGSGGALNQIIRRIEKPAAQVAHRVGDEIQRELDTISGREGLVKARKAKDQILANAQATMESQYQTAVAQMRTPEYQQALAINLAKQLRQDPTTARLVSGKCGGMPYTGGIAPPSSGFIPGTSMDSGALNQASGAQKAALWGPIGAVAAVGAFLFLGKQ